MLFLAELEIVEIEDDGKGPIFFKPPAPRSQTYIYRLRLLSTPNSSGRTLPLSTHLPTKRSSYLLFFAF